MPKKRAQKPAKAASTENTPTHRPASGPTRKQAPESALRSREFRIIYAFVVLACVTVYSNSLHGDFVIDDSGTVLQNPDMHSDTPLSELLTHDFWGTPIDSDDSHKSYRPITVLTFRWTYAWSGTDPFAYHLVNLVLHIAASLLFTCVSYCVFTQPQQLNPTHIVPHMQLVLACGAAAAVFAVHPVHVEAVANVTGRAEMLTAVFVFLSFLTHNRSLHESDHSTRWFGMSLVLATVAVFCKETGLTVVAVNLSHHIALAFPQLFGTGSPTHRRFLSLLPGRLAAALACIVAYLAFRKQLAGSLTPLITIHDNALLFQPPLVAFLSSLNIHTEYARLLIFPLELSNDYSYDCIPMVMSVLDPRMLKVALLYAVVLYLGLSALHRAATGDCRRLLCLSWLVFPFLPASHILRVATTVGERLMYLPSAGLCLLFALALVTFVRPSYEQPSARLRKRTSRTCPRVRLAKLIIAVVVVLCGIRAHSRSGDWVNEDHLHETDLQVCPNSARLLQNVGVGYFRREQWAKALPFYERAFAVIEDDESPHSSMGIVLQHLGRHKEAIPYFEMAVELHPHQAGYAWNLGAALHDDGQPRRGLEFMERSLLAYDKAPPKQGDSARLHLMGMQLGTIYHERRNFTGAKVWYKYAAVKGGDGDPELMRRVNLLKEHSKQHKSVDSWDDYDRMAAAVERFQRAGGAPPPPSSKKKQKTKKKTKRRGKK